MAKVELLINTPELPCDISNTPSKLIEDKKTKTKANIDDNNHISTNEVSRQQRSNNSTNVIDEITTKTNKMQPFPDERLTDFKHIIYNLLVENFNNITYNKNTLVQPILYKAESVHKTGFKFNETHNPSKRLAELYAYHIRKCRLDLEPQSSVFIQDLYKFYLRAACELLGKYFQKVNKYTYLYVDEPLFIAGETLDLAENRIKSMTTINRKKKSKKTNNDNN